MSKGTSKNDVHDVKGKIATLEAHIETVRTMDSPERSMKSPVKSPTLSTSGSFPNNRHVVVEATENNGEDEVQKQSTTQLASQNRKSRLQRARQAQPEPGSLMQRRLSAKERRLASLQQHPNVQQQRQQQQSDPRPTKQGNAPQQLAPEQTLTSPSSLSHTRSPGRRPVSNTGVVTSRLSQSPSRKSAVASAQQHRALQYGNHHHNPSKQQPTILINNDHSTGSSGEQDGANKSTRGGGSSISRFHKLKMKGMDHAKLAQKRKEAAQKYQEHQRSNEEQEREHSDPHDRQPLPDPPVRTPVQQQQQPSPHHHHQQQQQPSPHQSRQSQPPPPPPQQQQQQQQQPLSPYKQQQQQQRSPHPIPQQTAPTIKSQDSPDHANTTDDEATLTSVARILDQEQTFNQNRDATTSSHLAGHRQPSPSSTAGKPPRLWMGEEKSEKAAMENNNNGIYPRPSSSSEYEPEVHPRRTHNPYSMRAGMESQTSSPQTPQHQHQQQPPYHQQQHQQQYPPPTSNYHHSSQSPHYASSPQVAMTSTMTPQDRVRSGDLMRRSQGSYPSTNGQHFYQSSSNRLDDDDRTFETFDYGVKDDDSQGSTTFQRQLLEADRKAREQSRMSEGNTDYMSQSDSCSATSHNDRHPRTSTSTPKKKPEDARGDYRQSFESPVMKTAAGVIGAATVGCFMIGPVGMLLGAAAVGIGVGVMQIPEEQRNNMAEKAKHTMSKMEEQAYSASEVLSNSCATHCKESGFEIPAEMSKFCAVSEDDVDPNDGISPDIKSEDSEAVRLDQVTAAACGAGVGGTDLPKLKNQDPRKPASPNQSRSLRSKKVACLRHVRIIPVSQIHGLEPSAQPRAWLDVLASADTSSDEKGEAMEEILILAKDKQRARIFLEEGILDSIMWVLSRYFEKLNRKPTDVWANPEISIEERKSAKLAATCCVSLGKAHCAAIHTEGDLLLMSLYERGTVPEERQLAQMLYEVPHHTRVTKTNDPTVVDPSMEVFALKQLTLPQAEEHAKSIKALADGR